MLIQKTIRPSMPLYASKEALPGLCAAYRNRGTPYFNPNNYKKLIQLKLKSIKELYATKARV